VISTILFDIYGTLIDISTDEDSPAAYETISKYLEYKGIYMTPDQLKWFYREEFSRRIGPAEPSRPEADIFKDIMEDFEMRMAQRERHVDADVREVFRCVVQKYAPPGTDLGDLSTDLSHLFRASTRKKMFLYPTVRPAMEEMQKRYRLGIVSNAQEAFTMPELDIYGLRKYFETIVLSSMAGVKKPNSKIFLKALENLNVRPQDTVFVGNDMHADIMGAGRLGMKTIFLADKPGQRARGVEPDAIVNSSDMFQVLTYVDRWNKIKS
jgi:putative hydrolase of the HAD superfamily